MTWILALALGACDDKAPSDDSAPELVDTSPVDEDGDGVPSGQDCDDSNAAVAPGLPETPYDGLDNDCDGATPDDDLDYDGWGAAEDCDDSDQDVHPGETEACNGVDDDCDGQVDDATGDTWYSDTDGDGYGDPLAPTQSCTPGEALVADATDCDDSDAAVNPGADEVCGGTDEDCDGATDEDASLDAPDWFQDADGDGYGDADFAVRSCTQPAGYAPNDDDCDDGEPLANPAQAEACDGLDNDCDGEVDEDSATDAATWYRDRDGDGAGEASTSTQACAAPSGWVADASDCDDGDASASPSQAERCDGVDNDCDGDTDEGVTSTWLLDYDGDGYGDDSTGVSACEAPTTRYTTVGGDCDDTDSAFSPGAAAGCDGEDYDCDGSVDNDADGDSYADITCGGDDCDDSDAAVMPEVGGGCALGTDCADLLARGVATSDGTYTIDQDGYGTGLDPVDVYCEMSFDGGGWLAVFNWPDPGSSTTAQAAVLHAALITNADMTSAVTPTSTSTAVYTSNLDLGAFTEVVYGWAASSTADVTHYGATSDSGGLDGACYLDGYCGAGVAVGSFDIEPTGTRGLTVYTGNSPTYPHVGLGWSGQIILWGYDLNNSSYGHWANWYDTKSCCTAGNTSDITTSGWRYVIYLR